jgi:predicted ATPase/DNA-binding winged helix-turn-helix (wHTH) protein
LAFGSFQLLRERKVLLENQRAVRIGSRALELLIALVERAGEIVGKNELMACVWPDSVVEENNLRVHIAALRKLLGDGRDDARFILNVAGRGYSFVAPVSRVGTACTTGHSATTASTTLPIALTRVLGRDSLVTSIVKVLETRRLVTIVGPAGIGKTTVGLAVADRAGAELQRTACFVDLAAITDPRLVAVVVAAAAGIDSPTEDPIRALVAAVRNDRLLLLLDNCEHVIGAVAEVVELLLRGASGITIVATSRERLMAVGEHVVALGPLGFPDRSREVSAVEAVRFPAIELFVERASSALDSFALTDGNIDLVVDICRRLDGVPLAVELVAARAGTLGLEVIASSLEQHVLGFSKGRRGAAARHQSLSATLAWSYRLLSDVEQLLLRRISVFSGAFSSEAAIAVIANPHAALEWIRAGLAGLVQRSLLVADTGGPEVRYRLLFVTRVFAAERLAESDEVGATRRRHAEYYRRMLEAAARDWDTLDRDTWLRRHGADQEDVRSALEWSFGKEGDPTTGAAIFVASIPFGVQLSLQEFAPRALLTLGILRDQRNTDTVAELRVRTAMAVQMLQSGLQEDALGEEIERMVALAEQLGVARLMTEALSSRAVLALEHARFPTAIQHFETLETTAKRADDACAVLVADRLGAQVFHWAGFQAKARSRAERVLRHPLESIPLVYGQSPVNRRVSMRIVLARVAWLEGRAEEARKIAEDALELAQADAPIAVCQTLGFASCPVALWKGDLDQASVLVDELLDYSQRYGFTRWYRLGLCFRRSLVREGPDAAIVPRATPVSLLHRDLLTTIDDSWFDIDSMNRATTGAAGWCTAELLRVTGDRSLRGADSDGARLAAMRYGEALVCARSQGALAWEMRAAISQARLSIAQGRRGEGLAGLESVYSRFSAGERTADLAAATELLASA